MTSPDIDGSGDRLGPGPARDSSPDSSLDSSREGSRGSGAPTSAGRADSPASEAVVATTRPARYGKQLTSHLGRRARAEWDEQAERGTIAFGDAGDHAELTCRPGELGMALSAAPETVERLEDVLGRHLVRFGTRDELVVQWRRADGTAGSRQENPGE